MRKALVLATLGLLLSRDTFLRSLFNNNSHVNYNPTTVEAFSLLHSSSPHDQLNDPTKSSIRPPWGKRRARELKLLTSPEIDHILDRPTKGELRQYAGGSYNGLCDRLRASAASPVHDPETCDCDNVRNNPSYDDPPGLYERLVSRLQGDFDNYEQVLEDRRNKRLPGDGGGHEHIHCTLVPCPFTLTPALTNANRHEAGHCVLAAFYFNGDPRKVFRFRMYQILPPPETDIHPSNSSDRASSAVRMKLNTLSNELEQRLRVHSEDPCQWWNEVIAIVSDKIVDSNGENSLSIQTFYEELNELISPLKRCDVLWDPKFNPSNHPYLFFTERENKDLDRIPDVTEASSTLTDFMATSPLPPSEAIHATMEAGQEGAIVDSISMIPGKRILIKDELSLWENEFWINDRGYDPDAETVVVEEAEGSDPGNAATRMPFVYGNRRGIPYKLQRVGFLERIEDAKQELHMGNNYTPGNDKKEQNQLKEFNSIDEWGDVVNLKRVVTNSDLEWTLGDRFRTAAVYQEKLDSLENPA